MSTKGIEGIVFDPVVEPLVADLLSKLNLPAGFDIYGLSKMYGGKGEVRLAHHGHGPKRKRARGVFARIRPKGSGAELIGPRRVAGKYERRDISSTPPADLLNDVGVWHEKAKDLLKGDDKSEVESRWDTVSGGQFESKRSRH